MMPVLHIQVLGPANLVRSLGQVRQRYAKKSDLTASGFRAAEKSDRDLPNRRQVVKGLWQ